MHKKNQNYLQVRRFFNNGSPSPNDDIGPNINSDLGGLMDEYPANDNNEIKRKAYGDFSHRSEIIRNKYAKNQQ